jgi:hypothetical protein
MEKIVKNPEPKEKKSYTAPKLTTHGDAAKLTQGPTIPIDGSIIRVL